MSILFCQDGAGPVTAHTSHDLETYRALFPGFEVSESHFESGHGTVIAFEVSRGDKRVLYIVDEPAGFHVLGYTPECTTESGVRVGDTLQEAKRKVPSLRCVEDGNGIQRCTDPALPRVELIVRPAEGRVTLIEWRP